MDETTKRKFLSYEEGAELYSLEKRDFIRLSKEAAATYRIGRTVLVNMELFENGHLSVICFTNTSVCGIK